MGEDPVPAVTEADATGEIAAIFADIRAVYRVGAVNLIWRHLATIPGALPWAWQAIRPMYVDGTIAREAQAFRESLRNPLLPRVPPEVFAALGLSGDDLARIRGVLAAYVRTNSMALIALTALSNPGTARRVQASAPAEPDAEEIPLPALTPLAAMPPHVAALVIRLNGFGTDRDDRVLASMYRHLSHWPPYLGLAWSELAPLNESGALHVAIAAASDQARARAATISVPDDPAPPGTLAAVDLFTNDVLARMVVICGILHAMTTALDD